MNSFMTWIGGKKLLRKTIYEVFPPINSFDRYIEVFGGAGWVLFGKEQHTKMEVFNDFNSDLINLYRCIKYHCDELQRELEHTLISREIFFDYKQQMTVSGWTDIQRAARFFYIIKASFGGDVRSFGMKPKRLEKHTEYLKEIQERLNGVLIENKDFENLIKVYDRPTALFYLDPPYLGTEKYYESKFSLDDHERLCEVLKNIKGRFILSYNNHEKIKQMYRNFDIIEVSRQNNLSNKQKEFKEVIIKNY